MAAVPSSGGRRLRPVAVALVAALVVVAGCGIGSESGPNTISDDDVPFGLLETSSTTTTEPTSTTAALRAMEVYMVQSGRLAPVAREVERPSVIRAFESLALGPTPTEAADGMRTALPPGVTVQLRAEGTTVVVDLNGPFTDAAPTEQMLALAQMVYTATAFTGIDAVRFLLDGEPLEVPRADGTLTQERVGRVDYETLR